MTAANPFGGGPKSTGVKTPPKKGPAPKVDAAPPAADEPAEEAPQTLAASEVRDPFAQPAGPGEYQIKDFLDEVLLVRPYEEDVIKTKISDATEVIRCDIIRLDNDLELCEDVLIFQSALLRTFRKVLNGPNNWTIGRLEMGEAKAGRSAPYIFTRVGQEDIERGKAAAKALNLQL